MTIPVSELEKVRILPVRNYKFEPRLLDRRDAQENLGLNAVLSYKYVMRGIWCEIAIRIEVDPHIDWKGHIPYSFQFLPPLDQSAPRVPSTRQFPIIRIVAAPGVNIYQPPLNRQKFSQTDPFVEIIRVQDVGLVPPLGRDIHTLNFVSTTWIDPDPTSKLTILPEHHVRIETQHNGVDIVQDMFRTRLIVRVKPDGTNSGIDRFLYKFVKRPGRNVLVLMATEFVKVELQKTGARMFQQPRYLYGFDPHDRQIQIEFLRVPNLFAFNLLAEYFFLEDFSRVPEDRVVSIAPIPVTHVPTTDDIIILSLVDATIGFIPVIGDLYDLAQYAYAIAYGTDLHGVKVSDAEIAVMGLCVLLPFVSSGMVRGAKTGAKAASAFGQKADVVEDLAAGMKIGPDETKLLEVASDLTAQGRKLPVKLVGDIVEKVTFPHAKYYVIDELLDASKSNFTHPKLQEKYRAYLANYPKKAKKKVDSSGEIKLASTHEQWAKKQTQGEASDLLEWLLGKEFRKTPKTISQGKYPYINASDVIRPSSLTNGRLEQFIHEILEDPKKLFRKIPSYKVVNGKISKDLFDTIKGNVGEILANDYKNLLLTARRAELGRNIDLFENVTIVIKKTGTGEFTDEFLEFTDGIIGGLNKDSDFVIKDLIEIKAGSSVAKKVQKQVFEWVDDKITDGARIRLPDGREFDYFPSDPNVKRIIGLANARRHVINPQGKSHLGMGSSQQIAAEVQRLELPADPDEIKFLTALIQNTHEVPLKTTTHAEIDYLVAELAQRISAYGVLSP